MKVRAALEELVEHIKIDNNYTYRQAGKTINNIELGIDVLELLLQKPVQTNCCINYLQHYQYISYQHYCNTTTEKSNLLNEQQYNLVEKWLLNENKC